MDNKTHRSTVVNLTNIKIACQNCNMNELCLPRGIEGSDLQQLEQIIQRKRPLKRGEYLFHQNDAFRSIYAVFSGSLKTHTLSDDGNEQITGFYFPGELVGLDAITSNRHPSSAKTLETTSYCEIPFEQLENLSARLPSLHHQLLRLMSKEILYDETMLMLLGKKSAEERLATLLLNLSGRFEERGFSPYEFHLNMSRNDIGNYLGLAVETVSRLFTRFQEQGLLQVSGKYIKLLDINALRRIITSQSESSKERSRGSGRA